MIAWRYFLELYVIWEMCMVWSRFDELFEDKGWNAGQYKFSKNNNLEKVKPAKRGGMEWREQRGLGFPHCANKIISYDGILLIWNLDFDSDSGRGRALSISIWNWLPLAMHPISWLRFVSNTHKKCDNSSRKFDPSRGISLKFLLPLWGKNCEGSGRGVRKSPRSLPASH